MQHSQNINLQEESDIKKITDLVFRNFKLFIFGILAALSVAFALNRYSVSVYRITSAILIKGANAQAGGSADQNDFLYGNLFGTNQNFQNELSIIRSYPIIEKTVKNLDLTVTYYRKGKLNFYEAYKDSPFIVYFLPNHPQPIETRFVITFLYDGNFQIMAESKNTAFGNFETNEITHRKEKWSFARNGKLGELIETPDLAFIIESRDTSKKIITEIPFGFKFSTTAFLCSAIDNNIHFTEADRLATVIKITLNSESSDKGKDILNELMKVYSEQNLERKNHLATITIDYIEKQLSEISDSLNLAEENLQRFRSSRQLLDISNQAEGIYSQYMNLQNQHADMVSRKRYFDYVLERIKNDNFSNLMLPTSIGISDQLLNGLMTELLTAQAQRSNLISNNQERNPLVQKLGIQIENLKKTITDNISSLSSTTIISIDELNKRIQRTEAEINRLPATQRQLGTIERKFQLNESIYNYLMEKHAEAKITKASNLPDDIIIEPAKLSGLVSPNRKTNYMIAFFLGFAVPLGFLFIKNSLKNTIESQDEIEHLTNNPVLGKILHNRYKTKNVLLEFPKSDIAESFRALRTNLDFYVRGGQKKVILVTSCLENDGKSFIASNLAMSYAQLGRKTILVDCDLRKPKIYFQEGEESREGLSSFMIDKVKLEDLIIKSPHDKLDYILSGILPPNPVELLALDRTENLLTKLKDNYEIIVLDTTPLAQVTDAYLLIVHSDIRIMVARYGQTLKTVFSMIMKDLSQKNVTNTCIVLNDNRAYRDQYGYGYGYYNKKGLFKKKSKRRNHKIGELIKK